MPRYGPYIHTYDPPITLWFDSETHTYLREFGSELVPQQNVTTILQIIDKPWLKPWAAKKTVEAVLAAMPLVSQGLDDYTESIPVEDFAQILDKAKRAHKEILDDAGDVGTQAHNALEAAIEYAIRNTDRYVEKLVTTVKDIRAQSCCDAALLWMTAHNVRWECTERKTYSKKYEVAGTLDGICLVDSCSDPKCCPKTFKDVRSIADWKSANQTSITFAYQVAAYKNSYQEETKEEISDCWILRLGKEDGKFEPWHILPEDHEFYLAAFLDALRLTTSHELAQAHWSESKKARTAMKKLVKKTEKW